MPKKIVNLIQSFEYHINDISKFKDKTNNLFSTDVLNLNEINQIYSSLFLEVFKEFESIIEILFIGLLSGNIYTSNDNFIRLVKITPSIKCKDILFGNNDYLNWLPYKRYTLPRAKLYFKNGYPFNKLTKDQIKSLNNYHDIRNAIAHKSESSKDKFQSNISHLKLTPAESTPPGYLRSQPYSNSDITQFDIALNSLKEMIETICK